jgi:LuxR family transcriptional regulator
MSDEEAAVHLETQALGLVAGYTYSTLNAVDKSASGFGLCFEHGFDQVHVDDVWQANENAIVSQLQLFELCVRRVPHIQRDRCLTPRQQVVLRWAAEGKTIGQIAQILKISQRTVEKHMKGARDTLAVGTTLEAVLSASNQGQI